MVLIDYKKPKNCKGCPFNNSDCFCILNNAVIDRDTMTTNNGCPIIEVSDMKYQIITRKRKR